MIESSVKYFSFNSKYDWQKGCSSHLIAKDIGLTIEEDIDHEKSRQVNGTLFLKRIDGIDRGLEWSRVTIDFENPNDSVIKISFYASDSEYIDIEDDQIKIDEIIDSDEISNQDKKKLLDPLYVESFINVKDALLKSYGRYLWIKIEMSGTTENKPILKKMRVYLPGEHIIDYLPEIYRDHLKKEDFFYRFLSIFQSFIFDLENEIYNISKYFDLEAADDEFVNWLCSWLDIDYISLWEPKRFKRFLNEAVDLYGITGTRQGLERLIEIYTGYKPFIIEYFQIKEMVEANIENNPYLHLYGNHPYKYYVLMDAKCHRDKKQKDALIKLIEDNSPAQTEAVITYLKPHIYLGMHTYLGINSYIGNKNPLILENNKSIPFDALLIK
ncbi:MAG: phage tail protein [Marinisporobacter sp.]|jgi:phage tail-like protein|nr:phage tail protein [Marinisporobacter sp.]